MSSRDQDPGAARRRSNDRVPPHDLQAEESLLGAMMLEPEAIAVASGTVRADDFYKPAHAHIFDAIHALYAIGQPVDPVTVADELRRNGLLETVGGHQALVRIMSSTPATSNASGYAKILEEHALLRKLIAVAGELAEMGYSMPEDVTKALDRAESMVYEVNQRRVTDTTAKIEELLGLNLDRLEQLYGRGEAITGVPSGYSDLDELLSGLQPSTLVVVGARPAMGKTSFALGMASHAALYGNHPVLLFSLEMGNLELSQRLLCAEARIDSARVRTGRLAEDDWNRVSQAIGQLASAPIWIDDNPNLTVMEIRAKARRLKSQTGQLGMIIVDYLQLMTGRGSAENRQVEVSEMSRGLKILARELECPVVALSQLSRQLEMRADKRPMLADLRESGCLTADARVLRADTGAEVTIGDLAASGERDIPVWSLDTDLQMVPATMTQAFSTGVKETFDLRLASGRTVRASANHPFLTLDGWLRLDELQEGSRIAVPRDDSLLPGTRDWPPVAARSDVDTVPVEVWRHVREVMRADGVTAHRLAVDLGVADGNLVSDERAPDRDLTLKVAELLDDDHLRRLAVSDVFWDRVVAIQASGEEEVFDATVESTHNFIANGIVVENSIEQDADVVMFLYRDDVYNPDSPDRGQAEVIVAKHRNGPTGTCRLAFLEQYTRFANMARVE